ncbi:hypothetical protein [Salininema proteolyticum]|uniref:Uncharacterized protein n=1 Tax=Salininema proteolyticum TaxID=1607685 RepID=A0ABV8TTG1_9ACTN
MSLIDRSLGDHRRLIAAIDTDRGTGIHVVIDTRDPRSADLYEVDGLASSLVSAEEFNTYLLGKTGQIRDVGTAQATVDEFSPLIVSAETRSLLLDEAAAGLAAWRARHHSNQTYSPGQTP